MGRTKRNVETEESPVKDLDSKSKAIDKANKARLSREKAQKSYREPSDSENSNQEFAVLPGAADDKDFSGDEEPSASEESGSDWDGQSSGSEYGKKKKKGVVAKGGAKGRGRGRVAAGRKSASASPKKGKGRGRGRAPASASSAAKNGSKKAPVKRARDASDESESEAESSGSEYGKKKVSPAKKVTPARGRGRGAAATKAKKSSPAPASGSNSRARRGTPAKTKSYKELSEDEELEVSEEEQEKKPVSKRAKLEEPKEKTPKKDAKKDEESEDLDEEMKSEDEVAEKADVKSKKANGSAPKDEKKDEATDKKESKSEDEDKDEDEKSKDERKLKEKSPVSESGESAGGKSDDAATLKNRTDTDYSKVNFACDKKTPKGDEWNFKISTWNVGGIRSWLKKNGLEYLKKESPDVMCLNEIKCNEKSKPEELNKIEGYPHTYWSYNSENSGQSGVAIFSKVEPKSVQYGLPSNDSDKAEDKKEKENFNKEGRLITVEYDNFYLINAYVPNSGQSEKSAAYPKGYPAKIQNGLRLKFDTFFKAFIKNLQEKKPVIVTGDLNVAHQEIDLTNPKTNDKSAGFTKEERDDFTDLLKETNLVDSFRALYPDKKGSYSYWSYRFNAREKNIGWRLDYFLLSEKIRDSLCENVMRTEVYGSDHCPIVLFFKN